MSMQLKEKKRRGAVMSSEAKITKGDASEDALLTESALLGPENPTNAGGGDRVELGVVLAISANTEVGEKTINETRVAVRTGLFTVRPKITYEPVGGKRRAPHLQQAHQATSCKFSML